MLAWLLYLLMGCDSGPDRVVVLGLDGLDPTVLTTLMDQGELPTFKKVVSEGTSANLWVPVKPIWSPVLWTGMASVYPPENHGVTHWAQPDGGMYDSTHVRTQRIWDVMSARGDKVLVLGWLITYPVSEVNGVMVSEMLSHSVTSPEGEQGVVWPTDAFDRVLGWMPTDEEVSASRIGYQAKYVKSNSRQDPYPFKQDETQVRAFEALWKETDADLALVYVKGADRVGHLASKMGGGLATSPATAPDLSLWVTDYYRYLDEVLARVMAQIDPKDTTLMVVSDHGFQIWGPPADEIRHLDPGLLIAWGGRTKAGISPGKIDQYDFARTLWVLNDLPLAEDQIGNVMTDWFDIGDPSPKLKTYTTTTAKVNTHGGGGGGHNATSQGMVQELQALGYLDSNAMPAAAPQQGGQQGGPPQQGAQQGGPPQQGGQQGGPPQQSGPH